MVVLEHNPLLSNHKPTDGGLHVALHPLVLLTISDYITRHTLRNQTEPIVGSLLGQQNGREITVEHVFEILLTDKADDATGEKHSFDEGWFDQRLQQCKCS
jgi:COP9 signalosome complex subunit 6